MKAKGQIVILDFLHLNQARPREGLPSPGSLVSRRPIAPASPRVWHLIAVLLALLALACQGETHLTSPVISVDLRHKLPPHLQRLVVNDDPSYPCKRGFKITSGEVVQRFTVIWKVLEQGDSRFITAVQVDPDGPIVGATSPMATAMLGELKASEKGGVRHQGASLGVTLQADKGCKTMQASTALELGTDFRGCQKPPQPKMKLLTPVE